MQKTSELRSDKFHLKPKNNIDLKTFLIQWPGSFLKREYCRETYLRKHLNRKKRKKTSEWSQKISKLASLKRKTRVLLFIGSEPNSKAGREKACRLRLAKSPRRDLKQQLTRQRLDIEAVNQFCRNLILDEMYTCLSNNLEFEMMLESPLLDIWRGSYHNGQPGQQGEPHQLKLRRIPWCEDQHKIYLNSQILYCNL